MEQDRQLIEILREAKNMVFFGGAGVSTESGIPDFRSSDGLYGADEADGLSPEAILHHSFLMRHPARFYAYYRAHMLYPDATPNPAHYALAELEAEGKLSAIVTQNIDGLHQAAGSRVVLELHGSTLRNFCTRCGRRYGLEGVTDGSEAIPTCTCGGMIRPDVVLYGESLNGGVWTAAEEAMAAADVLIVGGTSLTVQPAASLVNAFGGEHLVIINRTPTPYDPWAELVIRDPIGEVFERVMEEM